MGSTIAGYFQWLSLVKLELKVASVGRNRSLVTRASKCGHTIRPGEDVDLGTMLVGPPSSHGHKLL